MVVRAMISKNDAHKWGSQGELELLRMLAHVVMAGVERQELLIGNNQAQSVANLLDVWIERFEGQRRKPAP